MAQHSTPLTEDEKKSVGMVVEAFFQSLEGDYGVSALDIVEDVLADRLAQARDRNLLTRPD